MLHSKMFLHEITYHKVREYFVYYRDGHSLFLIRRILNLLVIVGLLLLANNAEYSPSIFIITYCLQYITPTQAVQAVYTCPSFPGFSLRVTIWGRLLAHPYV